MITELSKHDPRRNPATQPAMLLKLCRGDESAVDFLLRYNTYAHLLDDIVDGDIGPAGALQMGRQAIELYSHPFYTRHLVRLYGVLRLAHANYEDSVAWEHSPIEWQRHEADVIRHCGSDVVRAVVDICAGFDGMREISPVLRIIGYEDHHAADGTPH